MISLIPHKLPITMYLIQGNYLLSIEDINIFNIYSNEVQAHAHLTHKAC